MKKYLSLILVFAFMLSMIPMSVSADATTAELKSVTVTGATLIPSLTSGTYAYDVIVDDKEALLPQLNYALNDNTASYEVLKSAQYLGDSTLVKVTDGQSENTYKFTFREPYGYDASLTKTVSLSQETVLNSYSSKQGKTYPQNNASYIDKYISVVGYAASSDLAIMDFDLTDASINPFAPIQFEIYQTHSMLKQDTNIRVYLADSVSEWTRDTATYTNMITQGNLTYNKSKYAEYTYTVAGQLGKHMIDITSLIKDRLLKGERKFTVIVGTVFPDNASGSSVTWMAYGKIYGANPSANCPKIHYHEVTKSSDASLKSLVISNGISDKAFDPDTLEYNVAVKEGDTPAVSFIPSSSHANVVFEENNVIGQTTKIKLTSQDGVNSKEYKINFKSYADFGISETAQVEVKNATLTKNGGTAELKVDFSNLNVNKKKLTVVTLTKKNGVLVGSSINSVTKEYATGSYEDELITTVTLPNDTTGVSVEAYIYDTNDANNKKAAYKKVSYPNESLYTPTVTDTDKVIGLKADDSKPGNVIVYGKAAPNELITFFVAHPNKTLSQFSVAELKVNAAVIDMVKANNDGIWEKSVTFPDVAGNYVAYLDSTTLSDAFLHAAFAQKKAEIEKVYEEIYKDQAKDTAVSQIKTLLGMKDDNNITDLILGIDTSVYNTLTEEAVIEILYNITKELNTQKPTVSDDNDVTSFIELYNKAVTISKLNSGISVLVSDLISEFNFADSAVLTNLLGGVSSENLTKVANYIVNGAISGAKIQTISDLDDRIRRAILFTLINYPANPAGAQDIIDTYGAYLVLDMSNYNNVADKTQLVSELVNKGPFASVGVLSTELNNLAVAYLNVVILPPVVGGGGGGGTVRPSSPVITPAQGTGVTGTGALHTDDLKTESGKYFGDVENSHWAYEPTKYLNEKGILKGMDNGNFEPDRSIKREEFAKILVLAFNLKAEGEDKAFTDVNTNEWYYEYVKIAAENGIINGIGDGAFGVSLELSRQDIAVMLARVLDKNDVSGEAFTDDSEISDYAKDAVYTLKNMGVLSGTGNGAFEPKRAVTRAECAKIVFELIKE